MRRSWWRAGSAVVSVLVLGVAAALVWRLVSPERTQASAGRYDQRIDRVVVDIGDGDVALRKGSGGVETAQRLVWSTIGTPRLRGTVAGTTLTIGGGCTSAQRYWIGGRCSAELTVAVPDGVAVEVRAGSGEVSATGVGGPLTLRAATGSIRGEGLGGGDIDAHIDSGDVRLEFAAVPGNVTAAAESGDVTVALAPGAYRVRADSGQGERDVQVRDDPAATASITARTSVGAVHVRYR